MDMTEWEQRMEMCSSEAELKYLLKNKPKQIIKTGTPDNFSENDRLPGLTKLMNAEPIEE